MKLYNLITKITGTHDIEDHNNFVTLRIDDDVTADVCTRRHGRFIVDFCDNDGHIMWTEEPDHICDLACLLTGRYGRANEYYRLKDDLVVPTPSRLIRLALDTDEWFEDGGAIMHYVCQPHWTDSDMFCTGRSFWNGSEFELEYEEGIA